MSDIGRTYPCTHCGRIIDTTMAECRHCLARIDPDEAEWVASLHERVQRAGIDAAMLKQSAIWFLVSLFVMLLPVVGFVGLAGYIVLLFGVPLLFMRWWLLHGSIRTPDPDYRASRRWTVIALAVWGFFFLLAGLTWVGRKAGG